MRKLIPCGSSALFATNQVSVDQSLDQSIVEISALPCLAKNLTTDLCARDQFLPAPISNLALCAIVAGSCLLDLSVEVLAEGFIHIPKRFNVAVFDYCPLRRHPFPQIPANHLQVQRLDIRT